MSKKVALSLVIFAVTLACCCALIYYGRSKDKDLAPINNVLFGCTIGESSLDAVRRSLSEQGIPSYDIDSIAEELRESGGEALIDRAKNERQIWAEDVGFSGLTSPLVAFTFIDSTLCRVAIILPDRASTLKLYSRYISKYLGLKNRNLTYPIRFTDGKTQIDLDTTRLIVTYEDEAIRRAFEEKATSEL